MVDDYRREMNPIPTFIQECFDKCEGEDKFRNGSSIDDIMVVYNEWKAVNIGEIMSKQQMSKQLHKDKFVSKVIWGGGDNGKSVKKYAVAVNDKWKGYKSGEGKSNVIELFKKKNLKQQEEQEG